MKGSSIEYYHGNLVRKTIPSKNYDSIFNLRRHSKSINMNRFKLLRLRTKINKIDMFDYFIQNNKRFGYIHFIKNNIESIYDHSIIKLKNNTFSELKMAKNYFDKNLGRI